MRSVNRQTLQERRVKTSVPGLRFYDYSKFAAQKLKILSSLVLSLKQLPIIVDPIHDRFSEIPSQSLALKRPRFATFFGKRSASVREIEAL
jgi:hypothetical protein